MAWLLVTGFILAQSVFIWMFYQIYINTKNGDNKMLKKKQRKKKGLTEITPEQAKQAQAEQDVQPPTPPKDEEKPRFEVVEVVTQTEKVIRDNETGEYVELLDAISELLNENE